MRCREFVNKSKARAIVTITHYYYCTTQMLQRHVAITRNHNNGGCHWEELGSTATATATTPTVSAHDNSITNGHHHGGGRTTRKERRRRRRRRRKPTRTRRIWDSPWFSLFCAVLGFSVVVVVVLCGFRSRKQRQGHRSLRLDPKQLALLRQISQNSVKMGGATGEMLYKPITNITQEFRQGLNDDELLQQLHQQQQQKEEEEEGIITKENDLQRASRGKQELLNLLHATGITDMDVETVWMLPTWERVVELYGPHAVVHGLDQCDTFRQSIPQPPPSLGIAGLFNTGTNVLATYLESNCHMNKNNNSSASLGAGGFVLDTGVHWQVPWGKHWPASVRNHRTTPSMRSVDAASVLPVVLVRDPYSWMQSMCRNPYSAHWHHTQRHCPNLVPNQDDYQAFAFLRNNHHVPVRIQYGNKSDSVIYKWDSLAHLWSDWNRQYYDASFARLMVRFEDLLFRPKEVVERVCRCAGGTLRHNNHKHAFRYTVESAKFGPGHGNTPTSLVGAMIRYGHGIHRKHNLTTQDRLAARQTLDTELMHAFQYQHVP